MALENISTPRLMTDLHGVTGKIELPRGQRHIATCNLPVRSGFSEPLPLAEQYCGESDAVLQAQYQRIAYQKYQAEKERKIAEFQLKVKERLRAMKVREQQDMVDRTLQLTESENLLMKSVDPVKKPPIVASPLVAINSQGAKIRIAAQKQETDMLVKSNKLARSKLTGEKTEVVTISCTASDNSESESESETAVDSRDGDKENAVSRAKPNSEAVRIHRLKESRRAYSILERQRMKERARELEHKAAANKLRQQSERDRTIAEQLVNQAIIKCKAESPAKEVSLEKRIQRTVQKNKKISSQSDRLIKRLRSKISAMSPRPPSLCPCDADVLSTGPGLCATNCTFSDNSKAFAHALSSLVNCYQ